MDAPEKAFVWECTEPIDHLIQRESFPRCSNLGMSSELPCVPNAELRVQNAGVGQKHLGCSDFSLCDILEPGLKTPRHEGRAQDVEVVSHGFFTDSECP